MDELLALSEQLIGYDTSSEDGVHEAAGFIKGWLDSRGVETEQGVCRGLPVITATHGSESGPTVILHGHIDVVPAEPGQFEARIEGDRLIGRGAYDMKAALAAMMLALPTDDAPLPGIRVVLGIVSDEESEEAENRGSNYLVRGPDEPDQDGLSGGLGLTGDFAITGEPTDMHVGVAAKGVLALRLTVAGRAAHGSTPWLGENAVLRAVDLFRGVESLPFARESSELFDRPSINLGRIWGGDALNKVPDSCAIDVDIRVAVLRSTQNRIAFISHHVHQLVLSQFTKNWRVLFTLLQSRFRRNNNVLAIFETKAQHRMRETWGVFERHDDEIHAACLPQIELFVVVIHRIIGIRFIRTVANVPHGYFVFANICER